MKALSGDANKLPSLDGELVGILAGWGRFPIATAEAIHRRGGRVAILTIRHHAEESLVHRSSLHWSNLHLNLLSRRIRRGQRTFKGRFGKYIIESDR